MCHVRTSAVCPPSIEPANHDADNCCRMYTDAKWNSLLLVLIPPIKPDHIVYHIFMARFRCDQNTKTDPILIQRDAAGRCMQLYVATVRTN